jgi:K+-sensing histidine kinase KdpD
MEKDSKEITLRATYNLDRTYAIKYQKIHLGSHVTGVVAETGEGMIIKDSVQDQRSTKGVVQILRYRSAVVTPVTSEGEVVGIIALISEKPGFFTERDLKLLEFMGANISLAIVNSFLNQEISLERERTLDILEHVDEGIFQADLPEPIEKSRDLEGLTVLFYQNAFLSLINPSFQRQSGNNVEIGTPMHKSFEDIQLFRMLKEVLANGSVMGVERRWAGEEERLYEVSMVLISKDNRIKGVKGVRRDITSRLEMEEKLKESKAQTELYMDVLSHDIANINTAIMGFLDILDYRMKDDDPLRSYVKRSRDAIDRSTQMIRKVRGLSKVQKSQKELSMADLKERVNSNFDAVKREFPHKMVKMEMEAREGPVLVRCDEMVDDLLANLFRNSISSVEFPTIEIQIEIKSWEYGGGAGYLLSMTDNGKGVPEDLKERVMGAKVKENECEPGKGLGLYLVKGIIERYGGRIWFEDRMKGNYKEGTMIMVFFPAGDWDSP